MKKIRSLVIGVTLGGALGAAIGSDIAAKSFSNGWNIIEIGLTIGTIAGFCLALLYTISSNDNESRQLSN